MEGFLLHDSPESVSSDQLGRAVRPKGAELHQMVLPFQQCCWKRAGHGRQTPVGERFYPGAGPQNLSGCRVFEFHLRDIGTHEIYALNVRWP